MNLLLAGLSHHSSPVELREKLALSHLPPEEIPKSFLKLPGVAEGFFLSTCNRVEALVCGQEDLGQRLAAHLAGLAGLDPDRLKPHLYLKPQAEAVRHVFRVASSLDSLVVGEPQILGQLKEAYRQASEAKTLGPVLNRLMHKAFSLAKRVRTETGVCDKAVSVASAAVELAKKIFGQLDDKKVLLIGAGDMAELAAEHLLAQGAAAPTVVNRTLARAVELAGRFRGRAAGLNELKDCLAQADIVLSSTASPDPIITLPLAREALKARRHRPLFIIDIAVPRDVAAEVAKLDNVYLYDVDDLEAVVSQNLASRRGEADRAEGIVAQEVVKFEAWLKSLSAVPAIKAIAFHLEEIRCQELDKTLAGNSFNPAQKEALEAMTRAMMKKILHPPAEFLKRDFNNPDNLTRYLEAAHKLFGLDPAD